MTAQLHQDDFFDLLEDENRILIKSNVCNLKQLQLIKTTLQFSTEKTITRTFVCLAGRDQLTVPTNREKLLLKENGLGEKKLQIPTNASKEQVKEVLYK